MIVRGVRHIPFRILAALTVVLILFSPEFALTVSGQSDIIRFENISTEEGLSQNTVNAILQDRQGFLWFATEGGLNQYDGSQFTVYAHDPDNPQSLSDNIISAVFQDQGGALWVGTATGLDKLDRTAGTFTHYPKDVTGSDSPSGISVSAIVQDKSGTLWVGTFGGGLNALDLTTHGVTQYKHDPKNPQSLSNDTVDSIFLSREGELWIGTDGGLDRFDSKTGSFAHDLHALMGSLSLENAPVYSIYEDRQGTLWIGTQLGLVQWDRVADRFIAYHHDPKIPESLSDDSIRSIYEDSQGKLWIGSRNGLDQFDKTQNSFVHYVHNPNDPHSLSSNSIRSVLEDRSGVLWVGTSDGGLNKYARATQKFALYSFQPGLPDNLSDNNVWSILEDQSRNLWIGTFFSGLNKLDLSTGRVTIYRHNPSEPASLSDNEIRAILQDRNGTVWVGTERGGLDRLDPVTDTFVHYRHIASDPRTLDSDAVFSIFEDHLGRLWIGTANGGLNQLNPASGAFTHYQHDANNPTSLSDTDVRAIYEDHTGALWIGTFGGIDIWNNQGSDFTVYRHDPGNPSSLSNDMVLSILEDRHGSVWIGTFGGGLDRFDRNTQAFVHYTEKNGLPDDTVYGILADTDDSLWLSTNKGLSRFNPGTGTFRNYDISDGLQGNQFNPGAFFQSQGGEMFFGGTKGFNAFFPGQVKDNPVPPPAVITAFKKFNQTVQTDLASNAAIQLSYRDNFVSFEFAALDYNAPSKNQYAYRLTGVDKDWVYAGTRQYASYTNLPGGDYVFRVKASNNDGVWNSQETTLRIHITPPFWETWWFMAIIGLTVVAGGTGGYRLRVRDIEARNRDLGSRVEQRTHELAVLNNIAAVVNRSLDLTEILDAALGETMAVMHMDTGSAFRLDEPASGSSDESTLVLLAHRGLSDSYVNAVRCLPLRGSLTERAAETGKPLVHGDSSHPISRIQEAISQEEVGLYINVPLLVKGKLVGAVALAAREKRVIAPDELSLLAAIGQQVGMAVVNARLYEEAEQTAVTAERSRLARELHDSVTQLLYSVTLYAEAAAELLATGDTQTAEGHLRELRDTAQEALREMRLLIFELHGPAFGPGGLAAALQARLDAVETRGGIRAELQVEGSEQPSRLVQAELYNIAQEALNNALKHARADRVRIWLRFGTATTEMEISDDGVGFEPGRDQTSGGFGISGMNERSQKIGGTLEIDSAPGQGTTVTVRVPVNHPERSSQTGTRPPRPELE